MNEASPAGYPLPSVPLRPSWTHRRSQLLAAMTIAACLVGVVGRMPVILADVDNIALRILLPGALGFVLAFAPVPGTPVGRIARELTVLGLCASMFAGNFAPVMLACYPLLLAAAVIVARMRET